MCFSMDHKSDFYFIYDLKLLLPYGNQIIDTALAYHFSIRIYMDFKKREYGKH